MPHFADGRIRDAAANGVPELMHVVAIALKLPEVGINTSASRDVRIAQPIRVVERSAIGPASGFASVTLNGAQ